MSLPRRSIVLTVVATAIAAVVVMTGSASQAAFPGANGRLAFVRNASCVPDGDGEDCVRAIDTIQPDGTGDVTIVADPAADSSRPRWSADGKKIAFAKYVEGQGYRVFTANADGSGQTQISSGPGDNDRDPAWSPDGSKIVYSSAADGDLDLWIMNADGTNPTQLTNDADNDDGAAWSPDGTRIAFNRFGLAPRRIYTIAPDGSGLVAISAPDDVGPDWSPDGTRLVFTRAFTIHLMNADGSGVVSVREGSEPVFSPDGTRLAFVFEDRIWTSGLDGSNAVAVTPESIEGVATPDWQSLEVPATTTTLPPTTVAPAQGPAVVTPRFTG